MTQTAPISRSNIPVVLRIVLAVLLLVPGIGGLVVFALVSVAWLIEGFQNLPPERDWVVFFLFPSEACILLSVAALGIVLRYARWTRAPTASIVLAIVSTLVIAIGGLIMAAALGVADAGDRAGLVMTSGIGILIFSAPPFFHWQKARKLPHNP